MKLNRRTSKKQRATAILKKLFPEGIKEEKIWNSFVGCLKPGERAPHLSAQKLKIVKARKTGIKERIQKNFPNEEDQLYIIRHGEVGLQQTLTQIIWHFHDSHILEAKNGVFLQGDTVSQLILDWAAQAVITMLLTRIKARPTPPA
ncbi:hypothetical protein A3H66_02900 [Candidatus Falkowbacteria bacterium RIFCSPLOWO2_02_FULL_45_21]|uniref:Uncharacterized protein n=1 Tax=Candidatus Falkowbacteria bacterium RIFCSPLOWO2_02_FULL_45_21 TaxID=1797989 RepID=A0A1F5SD02_9BACT|nr:MAG: hypothetical protein A3H66_02900 [Candidatus Falkowbacteria bacterium RIFCSPLOWO2_02_FULL_45_21]